MFELLNKAELELNKSLDYYNHIGPLAQIKGVVDNKNAIYNNLEAIRKDKEMMNRYFAILDETNDEQLRCNYYWRRPIGLACGLEAQKLDSVI
jgi:hypothetical protein